MDEIKQYTVASIIGSYPAQFDKTRVVFTTNETGAQQLSGFFKYPPQVGKTISGVLDVKEKDGKTYHNFTPKSGGSRPPAPSPATDQYRLIMRELGTINTNILRIWEVVKPDAGLTSDGKPVPFADAPIPPKPISADDFNFSEDEQPF